MSLCTYQLARYADAEGIARLSQAVIEVGLQPSWPAQRVLWHMRDRESIVLTANIGAELAGFAIMRFGDSAAHLNLLAVAPAHQRRGIGRNLLAWLEDSAMVAGTFLIKLEVRAGNAGARAFYARLGFRELGELAGYYQGRENGVQMARDLKVSCTSDEN
jgi:ribosomal protein S18 acetylase RimI-like enzyme